MLKQLLIGTAFALALGFTSGCEQPPGNPVNQESKQSPSDNTFTNPSGEQQQESDSYN